MSPKKIMSILLSIIMSFCLALPVSADTVDYDVVGDVTLTYGMGETFLVVIPGNFHIDNNKKAIAQISALNVMLSHGSKLNISVAGDDYVDSWKVIDIADKSNELVYIIGTSDGENDIKNNTIILSVSAGEVYNSETSVSIYFTVTDKYDKPGNYIDTLTFIVDVN